MAFLTEITSKPFGFTAGMGSPFASLTKAIARRRAYYRTRSELNALSQRELDDLGIERSMITRLALEAAYGKGA